MLELHVPSRADFAVRQAWLADPERMAFNANWDVTYPGYDRETGCIDWPPTEWPAFEARLRRPALRHGYYFVRDTTTGGWIGDAHYEVDAGGTATIGINVLPHVRGQGLGARVLDLLVERVWRDTDAGEIVNEFEDERVPAVRTHRRGGFVPDLEPRDDWGRPTRRWRLRRPPT